MKWMIPTFWWSVFTFALIFVMQCINVIIRKQWTEQERLVYPIVELPYQLAYNTNRFLRSRAMWWGFGIASIISLVNGINIFFRRFRLSRTSTYPLTRYLPKNRGRLFSVAGMRLLSTRLLLDSVS